jgi:OOP family OmpA-OmpF porin
MAESSRKYHGKVAGTLDQRLIEALSQPVQHALRRSLRDDRQAWTEALYPVILPGIRMAVASALREAVHSLNQLLESGLSLRSWRWRWEARRTGKSFSEIVLLRTLIYRVEQILLVHRSTGLLLQAVAADRVRTKDTDLVAGMLTAVQEFVRDSFHSEPDAGLNELRMTDLTVWIEQGPWAVIAFVIRGNPPADLRATLRAAVDLVHQEMAQELCAFSGDAGEFVKTVPILEGCLQADYQRPAQESHRKLWLVTAIVATTGMLWAGIAIRDRLRWGAFIDRLNAAPGVMVTSHSTRDGKRIVAGFRDPMAADPARIMAESGIDTNRVSLRLRPFISLEPEVSLARVKDWVQPPSSVSMRLDGPALVVSGSASRAWLRKLRQSNMGILGIREIRLDSVRDPEFDAWAKKIEAVQIPFESGSDRLSGAQTEEVKRLAALLSDWLSATREFGREPRIAVAGSSDRQGDGAANLLISERRAGRVKELLVVNGLPESSIQIIGEGDRAARDASAGADDAAFRSVRIRLGESGTGAP